jgi:hypothetical protein
MNLKLENFVKEEKTKEMATELLKAKSDILAFNLLKEIKSCGELKKLRVFLKCQKRDLGINFAVIAIFVSSIALILPAVDKLLEDNPIRYIIISCSLAVPLIWVVIKNGVPLINNTNERNSKVDYLLWLIDEELYERNNVNKIIDDK